MAKVTDIISTLKEAGNGTDEVTLGEINDELGHRGTAALLGIPAALELTPIGGIPGVPSIIALIIGLFAVQIVFGREDMWLPGFLENRSVSKEKLRTSLDKLRPAAEWADRHLGDHLSILVHPPATRIVALAIILLCCTIPPLELLPFASSIPAGTILLFSLGLLTRDGRVMALAWIAFVAALWGIWTLWP
ncbi:exopolysaccharide biosynthesis protein [uncultured Jannaschia sp.]|uniref:exopolysaccharide biosynthesis protein n=1 Tax=uncultured Jannaschia sp. TaxID=293347 RepID=UPI002635B87F|nr:exopolysaccharide biosynthesis protein [uncultured Jannaschia sp.]